jgi:hypothetical protein
VSAPKSNSVPSTLISAISTTISSSLVPSPVRNPPKPKSKAEPEVRTKAKTKTKIKAKARDDSDGEKEISTRAVLKQHRDNTAVVELDKEHKPASLDVTDEVEEPPADVDVPTVTVPDLPTASQQQGNDAGADDSMVVLDEAIEEEGEPKAPKGKSKSRIQMIVPEPVSHTKQKSSKPRKVSGSKRPAPADEEEDKSSDHGTSKKPGASGRYSWPACS